MPTPTTPYSTDLGDRNPLEALRETSERIRSLTWAWSVSQFERRYAPGKWTARQILVHLAQCEFAFGTRVRMALAAPGYAAQDMDQDAWMAHETRLGGTVALDAFVAAGRMNTGLFESLSADERAVELTHPQYGTLTVDWMIYQSAGHQIHHLRQLETIAAL